jgi:hypothetical protein
MYNENKKKIIGFKNQKQIKKNNRYMNSCALIVGNHGIGKSSLIFTILNEMKYDTHILNFQKIKQLKNYKDLAINLIKSNNIFNTISKQKSKNIVLVIDDIESIISPLEKKLVESLVKNNEENWGFPIIFITNTKHNKFISFIKSNTLLVQLDLPTYSLMLEFLIKLCKNNKMILSNENVAKLIINHCQQDYRKLLCMLEDLYNIYNNQEITKENVLSYFNFSQKKDINRGIYSTSELLFSNPNLDISKRLILYESERTILPLMIQQNYINILIKFIKDKNKLHKLLKQISISLSQGDVIENYIYRDQSWSLQQVHGFYTCVYPTHMISNNINTKELINNINNYYFNIMFPLDFNRTSIKHINIKNIKNTLINFPNMNIFDIIYIGIIIKKLLDEDNYEKFSNILSRYNISLIGIQSVIKVCKIKNTKTNIPTTIIRKINEYITKNNIKK